MKNFEFKIKKICIKIGLVLNILIFIGMVNLSYAEYLMKWTNRYDGGNIDASHGVAVDSSGNVYVAGQSYNGANYDYCTIKYDSSGTAVWTNFYDGGMVGDNFAWGVAVDSSVNVYVTGYSWDTNENYCTIKYDSSGTAIWTNFYDGGNDDRAYGVAVDSSSNIYVTGYSYNGINNIWCTIKYTSTGFVLKTNFYVGGGGLSDLPFRIAVGSGDNVYITGKTYNGANYDYCTIKYDSSGTVIWTNFYDGGSADRAYGVAVDSSDNVYVAGESYNGANYDYCTIKYDSSGTAVWTNFYDGGSADRAYGVAVESSGNVYITGKTYNGANNDYCTIKYDSSGIALWTNFYDGGGNDTAWGVAVATNFNPDRVFITGSRNGGGDPDYFTYGIPPQRPPVNFSGTVLGTNAIIWQWIDNSDDEEGFQIQNPVYNIKGSVGMNVTVWTEYGLSPNTSYTRHCVATNFLGKSYDSNLAIVTTFPGPPLPPTPPIWISATAVSATQINLLWKDLSNETSYTIFRSTINNTNNVTNIGRAGINVTNFSDIGLNPDTTYYYWIKAYNSGGASPFSDEAYATTKSPFPPVWAVFPTYFNPEKDGLAKIYFAGQTPEVDIIIYDVAANIVKTWDNVTGEKYKEWDGRNNNGDKLNSGVYIVCIKGIRRKDINEIIKMIIIR